MSGKARWGGIAIAIACGTGYGGVGDGNVHSKDPISSLLVGGASGKLTGNRHIRTPQHTPHANLLLSILNLADISAGEIGNSTGAIALG